MKKLSLLFFSGLLSVIGAQAQTWTGATSSDWNTASNWNPATVPTATSSVSVNNGTLCWRRSPDLCLACHF